MTTAIINQDIIESKILFIRGKKVMLDRDLAMLYGVKTIALRQQVKRNINRFPNDFMFQLIAKEIDSLVSQNVIPSHKVLGGHGLMAFTEHGILMLSSILKSEKAIAVNIEIMRTFTKLRQMIMNYKDLKEKIESLEKKYDYQFKVVFETIKKLIEPPLKSKNPIGFK